MLEINKIYHGNNIEVMRGFENNSIDSIVTDPPYGISFMNKKWDYDVPPVELWKEALRVLKPGGHMLVACGTRTQHRMAVRIEDAGFEIRDIVAWVYGSGFPKSLDISKAIEKAKGVQPIGKKPAYGAIANRKLIDERGWNNIDNALIMPELQTDAAKQWQGWGTALKPAMELWTLARKPIKGTVAENVLKYGTGGLNIDGCRVGTEERTYDLTMTSGNFETTNGGKNIKSGETTVIGRFPANFIHDGSDEVVELFPNTESGYMSSLNKRSTDSSPNGIYGKFDINHPLGETYGDSGSAARFFYTAKASQEERNAGLYGFEDSTDNSKGNGLDRICEFCGAPQLKPELCKCETKSWITKPRRNIHPTVKPVDLMRYLVRLITPPNGLCLDMYLGSGTTAVACKLEGFNYIGIEREEDYVAIANARIAECDKDYKTKESMLSAQDVKEVYDIFDFIGDEDVKPNEHI